MDIDKKIDLNLNLLCSSEEELFDLTHFEDLNGKRLFSKHKSETFAKQMESMGLIQIDGEYCFATQLGVDIFNCGGWLKHKGFEMFSENLNVALTKLKNGQSITLTKDSGQDVSKTIKGLLNLGVLYQPKRFQYACDLSNRKNLKKLMELKSWEKFLDWSENENSKSDFINDFSGSTIGQVNQSSNFSNSPQTINTNEKTTTTRKKNSGKKFWELISENKLISGIILIIIGYLIKLLFGIEF